ncbi:MAG: hypothetical protein EB084_13420 [Proteobacteria bacterium]|nr:hypothetical protein [Pseudomonadota bacterium]
MRTVVRLVVLALFFLFTGAAAQAEQSHMSFIGFSRDGRRVAGCGFRTAAVFDTSTGQLVCRVSPKAMPTGVALSPDGKMLAVGTLSSQVVLYSLPKGTELRTITGEKRFGGGFTVTFSADGRWLITTGFSIGRPEPDSSVRVWDVETGALITSVAGPRGDVSPKGHWLTAHNPVEERVVVQPVPTGTRRVYTTAHLPYGPFRADDGRVAVIDDTDNTLFFTDLPGGTKTVVLPFGQKTDACVMSPDFAHVAINREIPDSGDSEVTVIRLRDRARTARVVGKTLRATMISARGTLAVEDAAGGQVRLVNAANGSAVAVCKGSSFKEVHEHMEHGFSPDGRDLAIFDLEPSGPSPFLRLFDATTGKVRWTKPIDG